MKQFLDIHKASSKGSYTNDINHNRDFKKIEPYIKDSGMYERATEYEKSFDIKNWLFYMAFDEYKHQGIGQKLLDMGVAQAKQDGYKLMIIESQNNNVPACKFYHKQGAVLTKVDMNAYCTEPACKNEVQFIWCLAFPKCTIINPCLYETKHLQITEL